MNNNTVIKERIDALVFKALGRHAKVLIVCFNVQFPLDFGAVYNNMHFDYFIKEFARYFRRYRCYGNCQNNLQRRKKSFDPLYLWCREKGNSPHPHFHVMFVLDGTVISHMPTLRKAHEIWNRVLDREEHARGLIHYANAPGYLLHRDDHVGIERTLDALYYLAKTHTKYQITGSRIWNSSRI